MKLGDMEPAQKHFQKVLEMEAPEELRGLAGMGSRRLRPESSRQEGRGWMRSSIRLDALRLFRAKLPEQIQIFILFDNGLPK
jgi:hypothetical protein